MRLANIALIIVIILLMSGVPMACGPKEVKFADAGLEEYIRWRIDKPEGVILTSDLEDITSIEAKYSGITTLDGMENCTNLTLLWLEGNQVSDISPLTPLNNLTWLYLNDNQISDVSPLLSLDKLKTLYLEGNPLSNTSIEDYIPQLEERGVLVVCGPIEVIFPDPELEAAIREELRKPEGTILSSDLKRLVSLEVLYSDITDLTGLEYCINLEGLYIEGNNISDISPLGHLTKLTGVVLTNGQISDVSPLASSKNLA